MKKYPYLITATLLGLALTSCNQDPIAKLIGAHNVTLNAGTCTANSLSGTVSVNNNTLTLGNATGSNLSGKLIIKEGSIVTASVNCGTQNLQGRFTATSDSDLYITVQNNQLVFTNSDTPPVTPEVNTFSLINTISPPCSNDSKTVVTYNGKSTAIAPASTVTSFNINPNSEVTVNVHCVIPAVGSGSKATIIDKNLSFTPNNGQSIKVTANNDDVQITLQ